MIKRVTQALCAIVFGVAAGSASAHQTSGEPFNHVHSGETKRIVAEQYIPTIWVDPDGCEHWVMDDGFEGYMTLKVDRQGRPTCHTSQSLCVTIQGGAFKHGRLSANAHKQLQSFFASDGSAAYKVIGHTNITGNDRRNVRVSEGHARLVAAVGQRAGARIVGVDGHGGRFPKVGHSSHENSRVEVLCLR